MEHRPAWDGKNILYQDEMSDTDIIENSDYAARAIRQGLGIALVPIPIREGDSPFHAWVVWRMVGRGSTP